MAKQVKLPKGQESFDFGQGSGGAGAKYPWGEWFSGELLEIERSVATDEPDSVNEKGTIVKEKVKGDYCVPTIAMLPKIKTAARARYKVCQTSRKDAKGRKLADSIIIQARDMTPEERVQEDAARVLDKMRAAMKVGDRISTNSVPPITGSIATINGSKVTITRDDGSTDKTTGWDRSDLIVEPAMK